MEVKRIKPDFGEYEKLSRFHTLIPVCKETRLGCGDPMSTFRKLADMEHSFILESVEKGGVSGRYTFMGFEPDVVISFNNGTVSILRKGNMRKIKTANPMGFLETYFKRHNSAQTRGMPPFSGGAVGYVGYDYIRYIENIPATTLNDIKMPEYFFMIAKKVIIFDHAENCVKIINNSSPGADLKSSYSRAVSEIEALEDIVMNPRTAPRGIRVKPACDFESNITRKQFCDSVIKAKDYIRQGEIFQIVLSQRLKTSLGVPPFTVYQALREINPSPYMFYLKMGRNYLIGSSPETHVKVIGENITIRPIAGTRGRGKDKKEDKFLEKNLLADEKEKAEHLMLVDLARNDLGRVARIGSVRVDEFMKVLKYSHVMHIESNVIGKMAEGRSRFDVFTASFPAGTVSGAPKIRAMELINELEPTRRGTYAGAVGYFSFSGNMDTCITIRTILIKGNDVYVQAGAGIVADSVPAREYNETLNKARAMMEALSGGGGR